MTTVDTKKILEETLQKLKDKYELGDDFLGSFEKSLKAVLSKVHIYDTPPSVSVTAVATDSKKGGGKKKKNPFAKKNAYNIFVKENIKNYSDIPQKERMSKCAAEWKKLEDKSEWKEKAAKINAELAAKAAAAAAKEAAKEAEATEEEGAEATGAEATEEPTTEPTEPTASTAEATKVPA